jgi:two-component system LytT family response regulator
MKILIIEDEPAAARRLERFIAKLEPSADINKVLSSVEDAVGWLKTHPHPEVIFMDIQLEDGDSFEILNQVEVSSYIIFITAFDEFAIKAFKYNSIDYLLKPLKEPELQAALNKYHGIKAADPGANFDYKKLAETIEKNQSGKPKRLLIHIGSQLKTIEMIDIAYVFTKNKLVYTTTFDGNKLPIDFSLDQFEEMSDAHTFFRINRQFIVNVASIDKMHVYSKSRVKLVLKPICEEETIVSTERSSTFKKWITGSHDL